MERAGFGARLVAAVVDFGLLTVVMLALIKLTTGPIGWLAAQVLALAYYTYFEGGPSGQTPGKRLLGIRVVDLDTGASIGHGRALVRMIMRFASLFVLALGFLWMLWDPKRQTWHDKVANAAVIPV